MGEITDAILSGETCSLCGVWFEREHGFPVLCRTCWADLPEAHRIGHDQATEREL